MLHCVNKCYFYVFVASDSPPVNSEAPLRLRGQRHFLSQTHSILHLMLATPSAGYFEQRLQPIAQKNAPRLHLAAGRSIRSRNYLSCFALASAAHQHGEATNRSHTQQYQGRRLGHLSHLEAGDVAGI